MKNIFLTSAIILGLLASNLFGGKPDERLHKKCLYPTVMLVAEDGSGTGVIIQSKKNGKQYENLVLTCSHVFGFAHEDEAEPVVMPKITIRKIVYKNWSKFEKYEDFESEFVMAAKNMDVAVLKFYSDREMETAELDKNIPLYVGNDMCKVGCGLGDEVRIDFGKITSLGGCEQDKRVRGSYRCSATTMPGDSGGPVFHEYKLIGLAQSIRSLITSNDSSLPIWTVAFFQPLKEFKLEDAQPPKTEHQ